MTDFKTSQTFRSVEVFKAAYDKSGTAKPHRKTYYTGETTWLNSCRHYDKLWREYPLFRQAVTTLAGMVNPQGIFFKPAVNRKDETYRLAEEAEYRCTMFRDQHAVNTKLYNTAWTIAKYGSCFWELTETPNFDFRLPPMQEHIEPYQADAQGNITSWRQIVNGQTAAQWTSDELVLLSWNPTTDTWPYGNGLGVGLETEMEMLIDVEQSVRDYSEKAAWPYEILQLGDSEHGVTDSDYSAARSEWRSRQPGEGIATRNMPVNIIAGGTNSAPIRELAALCALMKDNIHDGFIVPPLSKLYNSTEASAKVMTQHVMTVLGQPLQWLLRENLTSYVLKPFLEASGFSRKSCPVALFESPDVAKKEEGEFWVSLVNAKVQSPVQACEHLDLEYDEDYWLEEERKQQAQFEQKQAKQDNQFAQPKSEEVWEVRKKQSRLS
jgi:hypothetical protein